MFFKKMFVGSIRLEPGMKVREEKNCKKSPFAFVVETPVRRKCSSCCLFSFFFFFFSFLFCRDASI